MQPAKVKITILVDNFAGDGFVSEHGLSFWIETEDKHILFDTGQGEALKNNAHALGIDLSKTDMLVLSHGHYDHTGDIPHVLQMACNYSYDAYRSVSCSCDPPESFLITRECLRGCQ